MQEIGILWKWEKVGNLKKKEIQKSRKAEKEKKKKRRKLENVGNQNKSEM